MNHPQQSPTLHIETLNDELSVYDWQRLQMHSLNPTASAVFEMCDGQTSPAQMAKRLNAPEAVVWQSLDELNNAHLLSDTPKKPASYQNMTRQQFLKLGGAVALASIVSIVVPRPAAAQSAAAVAPAPGAAIVMYRVDDTLRDGNLGGRAGADALCAASANRPAGYANARAFISVGTGDAIADMPGNYGVPTTGTITGPTGTLIANDWADLLDGSIADTLENVGVTDAAWWSGSNDDGSLHADNCTGWTATGVIDGRGGSQWSTTNQWLDGFTSACSIASRRVLCIAY